MAGGLRRLPSAARPSCDSGGHHLCIGRVLGDRRDGAAFAGCRVRAVGVGVATPLGPAGTTIGLGLLFDTLIVRSLMTPSMAALPGRWFWWPIRVRPRPASHMLRPFGPRRLVRSLLLGEDADNPGAKFTMGP